MTRTGPAPRAATHSPGPRDSGPGRRRFLSAIVAAGLGGAAVGCRRGGTGTGAADLDAAATAARMEKLVVDTYAMARMMATQGQLGAAEPPAVVEFVITAAQQHQEHLDAWNGFLAAGGRAHVSAPDPGLKAAVDTTVGTLVDVPAVARLALRLEDYASQAYLKAIPTLTSRDAISTAARIVVVDQQHQAVLRYLLGLYPVGSGLVRDLVDVAPADPRRSLITG